MRKVVKVKKFVLIERIFNNLAIVIRNDDFQFIFVKAKSLYNGINDVILTSHNPNNPSFKIPFRIF